jgi:hypothetical protein
MDSGPATTKPVRIACPNTSAAFKVLLKNDTDWLAKHWHDQMSVQCPRCGKEHSYRIRDIYLSEAIADDKTIPNLFAA